ncbi:MAG: M1 family peptidase [Bacteroidetes bacterium]|nr:M1 family peptidase [Bacteroidota bacterium]
MYKSKIVFLLTCISFTNALLAFEFSDTLKNPYFKKVYQATNKRSSDIIHTTLKVSFDWNNSQLKGEAEIIAKPYFKANNKISLNAKGMEILAVDAYDYNEQKKEGSEKLNSTYKYANDSLTVDLGRTVTAQQKFILRIKYIAKPNGLKKGGSEAISDDRGLYFINPKGTEKNKMPQVWTQGETQSNSVWFPTIDSPNEKMTNDIYMTVEDKYTTLSNGVLNDSKKNSDGTRTDHWVMDLPHSPYLVMMGVGEFKKITDAPWNGKEISYYVEKEYEPYAKEIFGDTKEMIEFYSKVLGTPFPWQKYSQIVVRDFVSGAMENTTATLHGDFMIYQNSREMLDGKKGEDVISHELFHQWFGDYVTAESWSNLPLNESFATYGEYLWQEYKYGRDAADAHSNESRIGYFNSSQNREVDMIRFNYGDKEEMFDQFSYNKGGQILHMLRKYVGDAAFFASLKLYLEKNKFKNAEIHDLRLAFEEVTGEDLNWFFNEWFLAKGFPLLDISKEYNPVSKTVKIKIIQAQDLKEVPLYVLPVDVDIYADNKVQRHRIVINQKEQEFFLPANTEPQLVNFDAERQLLYKKKYNKSDNEYIFQYSHAPLFLDRYEALYALKGNISKKENYEVIMNAALNDKWQGIRSEAIAFLKPLAKEKEAELKPLMTKILREDKNNLVRSAAINFLGQNYQDALLEPVFESLLNEQSYAVVSSALQALAAMNGEKAVVAAEKFTNEKNEDLVAAVSFVYAMGGADKNIEYFHQNLDKFSGYEVFEFLNYYISLVARCKHLSSYETFFSDLEKLQDSEGKSSGYIRKIIHEDFLPLLKKMPDVNSFGENFKSLKEKVEVSGR